MIIKIPTFTGWKFINDQDIVSLEPAEYLGFNSSTIPGCDIRLSNGSCLQSGVSVGELQKYINQQLGENK